MSLDKVMDINDVINILVELKNRYGQSLQSRISYALIADQVNRSGKIISTHINLNQSDNVVPGLSLGELIDKLKKIEFLHGYLPVYYGPCSQYIDDHVITGNHQCGYNPLKAIFVETESDSIFFSDGYRLN